MADSNSSEHQLYQTDGKPDAPTIVKSRFTIMPESSNKDPVDLFKSTLYDLTPRSFPENFSNNASSVLKKSTNRADEVSTENTIFRPAKISDSLENTEPIKGTKSAVPQEAESNEELKPVYQAGSLEEFRSVLQAGPIIELQSVVFQAGQFENSQPTLPQKVISIKEYQLDLPQETGSVKEIQPALYLNTGSKYNIQSHLSQKTKYGTHSSLPQETVSIEESELVDSEETNLIVVIQFPSDLSGSSYRKDSSSDNKKDQIASNDMINPSVVEEISSARFAGVPANLSNPEEISDSSGAVAKDKYNFTFLQDVEKYKGGTHFVIPYQNSGGYAARRRTPTKLIFSNFKMPSLPLKNFSNDSFKILSPISDSEVSEDLSCHIPLSTLLTILVKWVEREENKTVKTNIMNLMAYAEIKLDYGLNVIKKMKRRVQTLLRAADGLPNPVCILRRALGIQKFLIREDLKEAGNKVLRRIKTLETNLTEDYGRFLSVCRSDSNFNSNEIDIMQLKAMALKIFDDLFVNASGNILVLRLEIEYFRNKIRNFCQETERFL